MRSELRFWSGWRLSSFSRSADDQAESCLSDDRRVDGGGVGDQRGEAG